MVQTEKYQEKFIRTWSDQNVYITPVDNQDELYTEAIDLIDNARTYIETDIAIESDADEEAVEDLGVDLNEEE